MGLQGKHLVGAHAATRRLGLDDPVFEELPQRILSQLEQLGRVSVAGLAPEEIVFDPRVELAHGDRLAGHLGGGFAARGLGRGFAGGAGRAPRCESGRLAGEEEKGEAGGRRRGSVALGHLGSWVTLRSGAGR